MGNFDIVPKAAPRLPGSFGVTVRVFSEHTDQVMAVLEETLVPRAFVTPHVHQNDVWVHPWFEAFAGLQARHEEPALRPAGIDSCSVERSDRARASARWPLSVLGLTPSYPRDLDDGSVALNVRAEGVGLTLGGAAEDSADTGPRHRDPVVDGVHRPGITGPPIFVSPDKRGANWAARQEPTHD